MSIWWIIALVILGLGLLAGIVDPSAFLICLPFLALEGIIYGLIKLPAWVLSWTGVGMVVKIAFLIMPYLIVLGILIVILGGCIDNYLVAIIGGILSGLGLIAGIVAGAYAWIPSTSWRIATIILFPLVIAFICVCIGAMGGGGSSSNSSSYGLLSDGYGSEQC
jgi:hypothetical protein